MTTTITRTVLVAASAVGVALPLAVGQLSQDAVAASTPVQAQAGPAVLRQPTAAQLASAREMQPIARVGQGVGRAADRHTLRRAESLCQQGTALGQRTQLVRDFPAIGTTEVVLGFTSTAKATAARATILRWYQHCVVDTDTNSTDGAVDGTLALRLSTRQVAGRTVRATALNASRRAVGRSVVQFENASVVQVDNRLAWVIERARGEDNECSVRADDEMVGQCGAYAVSRAVALDLLRP